MTDTKKHDAKVPDWVLTVSGMDAGDIDDWRVEDNVLIVDRVEMDGKKKLVAHHRFSVDPAMAG